jgi:chemotaxis protein methyltransferase CheR
MQTSNQTIPDSLLQQVSERIEISTGLHFPPARFADLQRGLAQAARESGSRNTRAYTESLLNRDLNSADLEILAGSLTIGETHFFRDVRAFEFFETTLLPGLIAAKRGDNQRIRIWSAGCATGEEPYSIAILLHRLILELGDWHISILATDINPKVLARAAVGVYTEWAFRDTPAWVKQRYFITRPDGRYEIQPWLKRMVSFAYLNLADDDYPSILNRTNALDLIICRNVLLYFAAARIPEVVARFHRALVDKGHLVLGSVEASQMQFPAFASVPAAGMALYRKDEPATQQDVTPLDVGGLHGGSDGWLGTYMPVPSPPVPAVSSPLEALPTDLNFRPSTTPEIVPQPQASNLAAYAEARDFYVAGRYLDACARLMTERPNLHHADPQIAMLLAQCHANLGELAEASVWCEHALTSAKTDVALHFLHANILQELQRDDEALRALRNVLFLDPDHVLAHLTMANLHRRHNRMPEVTKHLANVRQLLSQCDERDELPQSAGLTVGRLKAMLAATTTELAAKNERHQS